MNESGELITDFIFGEVRDFSHNVATVTMGTGEDIVAYIINYAGEIIG